MTLRIIAIGKKHESWVAEGIARYESRLTKPWNISWILIPHSQQHGEDARRDESGKILSRLSPDDFVILLDERGTIYDSPQISSRIASLIDTSRHVVFVIGGAYGVSEEVRTRANDIWSLSHLVFPHQLVRLILIEQLYRSWSIHHGRAYHNE